MFVCLHFSKKFDKKTRQIESFFTDNASSNTSAQISVLLTGQNFELMDHPPYSADLAPNDFSLFPHIEKNARIRHQKLTLECSKTGFCGCLNRSEKTSTNDSRTSKHSKYHYAKKQMSDFIWQHQKYSRPEIIYVCCGVRGRALASHIAVRGFKPQRDSRTST